jgi:hypothetical protein
MINVYNILVRKPYGKRPVGGPRSRWENFMKLDITETGGENID